jgi:hypothetical protein
MLVKGRDGDLDKDPVERSRSKRIVFLPPSGERFERVSDRHLGWSLNPVTMPGAESVAASTSRVVAI